MAGALRTAIYSKFTAATTSALYTALGGTRLYYSEAPETPTYPYCVFFIPTEIPDWTFDLDFEESLVQFDYYAETATACDTGIEAIKALFDFSTLTISGQTFLRMHREMTFRPDKVQPENIWEGNVRYAILAKT